MPLMSKFNREVIHSDDVVQALALTFESSKYFKNGRLAQKFSRPTKACARLVPR